MTFGLPNWAAAVGASPSPSTAKRLIFVEMQGGNDALNTLIPHKDPLYARYRPTIAVPAAEWIGLTDDLALNSALRRLSCLYQQGELAIVQDVGYPNPNLSHFESAAIWASGRPDMARSTGWVARTIAQNRAAIDARAFDADGIVLGGNADFLSGQNMHVLAIDDVKAFISTKVETPLGGAPDNSAARRVMAIVEDSAGISRRLQSKLAGQNRFNGWFMKGGYIDPFNAQLALLLRMIEADGTAPAYKVSLTGFDMHAGLRGPHEALLDRFDAGMEALARGLKEIGVWRDTLVVAASEFGRRPGENASGGTDHGTSGPVFLMGGGIKGGLYGTRADLAKLDADGNPVATTDFRSLYSLVIERFWRFAPDPRSGLTPPIDISFA